MLESPVTTSTVPNMGAPGEVAAGVSLTRETLRWPSTGRWGIVAVTIVTLVILGQLSFAATKLEPSLGLRAAASDRGPIVTWVQPLGLAWSAGIRPGDIITNLPVAVQDIPAAAANASTIEVRSASGEILTASSVDATWISQKLRFSFLAVAVSFIAVGGAVFLLTADRVLAIVALLFGTTAATAMLASLATPFGQTWAFVVVYLSVIGFGAGTFLLFLTCPVNRLTTHSGRWAAGICISLAVTLILAYAWVLTQDPAAYATLRRVAFLFVAMCLLGGAGLVVLNLVQTPSEERDARRALGLVAIGSVAGVAPICVLCLVPLMLGLDYVVEPQFAVLSMVLLPASLAATTISSRQLFGIVRILSRGLVGFVVWIGLLGIYGIALVVFHQGFGLRQELVPRVSTTALVLAMVVATFWPVQNRLRRGLERLLFRDVYSYAETLQHLSSEIVHLASVDTIAMHVLDRLGATLDLAWAAIVLETPAPGVPYYCWGDCPANLDPRTIQSWPDGGRAHFMPLVADGLAIGTLAIGPRRHGVELLRDDRRLITTLAPLIATALQNALLVQRLESQVAVLEDREHALAALSTKLMQVQEEERRRLALDLHDDPLQRAILLARQLNEAPPGSYDQQLAGSVEEIIISLRAICTGLHPPALDDFGLVAGLDWLLHDVQARSDLTISLSTDISGHAPSHRLEPDLEIALYRVAQEALNNCLKHAGATQVSVTLCQEPTRIWLRVVDDGQGIDPDARQARESLHLGILGMRERLRPWGGSLSLEGNPSGGTVVSAEIPLGGKRVRAA